MAYIFSPMDVQLSLTDQLAWDRTRLAVFRTSLSFLRTAMYFIVAGYTVRYALDFGTNKLLQYLFIVIGLLVAFTGILFHFTALRKLKKQKHHMLSLLLAEADEEDA